jgi:hypothetical protein
MGFLLCSDLRRQRLAANLADPDPARKHDTLKDKVWLFSCYSHSF